MAKISIIIGAAAIVSALSPCLPIYEQIYGSDFIFFSTPIMAFLDLSTGIAGAIKKRYPAYYSSVGILTNLIALPVFAYWIIRLMLIELG